MTNLNLNPSQKKELGKKIRAIISSLAEAGSWCKLSSVGAKLNENGISYKDYQFAKLGPFLQEFCDFLELRNIPAPKEGAPPISEVRIIDKAAPHSKASSYTGTFNVIGTPSKATCGIQKQIKVNKKNKGLFEWAYVSESQIEYLAENLAIHEKWFFGEEKPVEYLKKYAILIQYLRHTFGKLYDDNGISYSEENGEPLAVFNTGLVDKKYEYIYALFEKNQHQNKQEWCLKGFFVAGSDWGGKLIVRCFNPPPSRADYFKGNMNSVLYEPESGKLHLDIDHILIENCRRLPAKFFEDNCRPDNFTIIDGLSFSDAQKLDEKDERSINYFNVFQQKLKDSEKNYRFIKQLLDQAVELAKKRAEWNYKTAIPMYYPTHKKMSFLLPLSLLEEGKVDIALVVEKMGNGNYQGQTIIPLDWAYSNSRLITKPESDWLNTNNIANTSEEESNESSEAEDEPKQVSPQDVKSDDELESHKQELNMPQIRNYLY